jgi:hypothetical protein
MDGQLVFATPTAGGTLVHLTVPREKVGSQDGEPREKDLREKDRRENDQSQKSQI